MAIFYFTCRLVNKGSSVIASSAYQSAERLYDARSDIYRDYRRKDRVAATGLLLPENAPKMTREQLWNLVEGKAKKNAVLARKLILALPVELGGTEAYVQLIEDYLSDLVDEGMACDYAIHNVDSHNPHAHVLLATRGFSEDGTLAPKSRNEYIYDTEGNKIPILMKDGTQKTYADGHLAWKQHKVELNDWNSVDALQRWRKGWEQTVNKYLKPYGTTISSLSYRDRDNPLGLEAQVHEGYYARQMEKTGLVSERCEKNRQIFSENMKKIKDFIKEPVQLESRQDMEVVFNGYDRYKQAVEGGKDKTGEEVFISGISDTEKAELFSGRDRDLTEGERKTENSTGYITDRDYSLASEDYRTGIKTKRDDSLDRGYVYDEWEPDIGDTGTERCGRTTTRDSETYSFDRVSDC